MASPSPFLFILSKKECLIVAQAVFNGYNTRPKKNELCGATILLVATSKLVLQGCFNSC